MINLPSIILKLYRIIYSISQRGSQRPSLGLRLLGIRLHFMQSYMYTLGHSCNEHKIPFPTNCCELQDADRCCHRLQSRASARLPMS